MSPEELETKGREFVEAYRAGIGVGSVERCRQWEQASDQMAREAAASAASMPPIEIDVDGLSSRATFRADTETSGRARERAEGYAAAAAALEALAGEVTGP